MSYTTVSPFITAMSVVAGAAYLPHDAPPLQDKFQHRGKGRGSFSPRFMRKSRSIFEAGVYGAAAARRRRQIANFQLTRSNGLFIK